jgi:hypothetical protein
MTQPSDLELALDQLADFLEASQYEPELIRRARLAITGLREASENFVIAYALMPHKPEGWDELLKPLRKAMAGLEKSEVIP